MNTNSYFIEYLVAGTLTIIWCALLMLGIVGIKWVELLSFKNSFVFEGENLFAVIVVFFPVVYVIGIITDRLVDNIFDMAFTKKTMSRYFKDQHEYDKDVTKLFLTSIELSNIYSSTRMRIRIVRTAAFSALMTFVSMHIFVWGSSIYTNPSLIGYKFAAADISEWQSDIIKLLILFSVFLLLATFTAFRAWNMLIESEYKRLITRVHCIDELKEEEEKKRQAQ